MLVLMVPYWLLIVFHLFGVASLTALFKHTEATTDDQIRDKVLNYIRDKVRVFSTTFFFLSLFEVLAISYLGFHKSLLYLIIK